MAHVSVSVQVRFVQPVDGCVSEYISEFGKDPFADILAAVAYADNRVADDANVYEAVACYSITDREREARVFGGQGEDES